MDGRPPQAVTGDTEGPPTIVLRHFGAPNETIVYGRKEDGEGENE